MHAHCPSRVFDSERLAATSENVNKPTLLAQNQLTGEARNRVGTRTRAQPPRRLERERERERGRDLVQGHARFRQICFYEGERSHTQPQQRRHHLLSPVSVRILQ